MGVKGCAKAIALITTDKHFLDVVIIVSVWQLCIEIVKKINICPTAPLIARVFTMLNIFSSARYLIYV